MKVKLENNEETNNIKIDKLFEDARQELNKIESEAKGKKKKIILDLAASLEGKIREDTISTEIVSQLVPTVSERFIHETLPEKYKQKYRVDNAKKQKKRIDKKLAAVTPLNQETELEEDNEEDRHIMLIDVDGNTIIQNEENNLSETNLDPYNNTDTSFTPKTSQPQESEQEQLKKKIDDAKSERSSEESNQLNDLDKTVIDISTAMNEHHKDISNSVLHLEFCIQYKELQRYMAVLFRRLGDKGKVWFNIKIDKEEEKIIHATFGTIGENQKNKDE